MWLAPQVLAIIMTPWWYSKSDRSSTDDKDNFMSNSVKRRDRRKFANSIDSRLSEIQNQLSQHSNVFEQILTMCRMQQQQQLGLLHMSMNQVFSSLGELQANVRGANVSSPPACLQLIEVVVEVPAFHYKSKIVEVPQTRVIEKAVESQWEVLQ